MSDAEDAKRYQFLKSCKDLELASTAPMTWTREDGSTFTSRYYFACNGTRFGGFATLDEMVDAAMNLQK